MPQAVAICTPVTDHMVLVEEMPQPNQGAKILAQSWQCGGNAATAGAQVKGKPLREVLEALVASIDKFYENS